MKPALCYVSFWLRSFIVVSLCLVVQSCETSISTHEVDSGQRERSCCTSPGTPCGADDDCWTGSCSCILLQCVSGVCVKSNAALEQNYPEKEVHTDKESETCRFRTCKTEQDCGKVDCSIGTTYRCVGGYCLYTFYPVP